MTNASCEGEQSQADKFRQAAEDAQCDPDEKRWEERLRKVAGHRPAPEPEPAPE